MVDLVFSTVLPIKSSFKDYVVIRALKVSEHFSESNVKMC